MEPSHTSTPSETDIAWAAGLFEGEGFLVRRAVGKRVYLQAGIEMRDKDVLERFVDVMKANGVLPEPRSSGPRNLAAINKIPRNQRNPKHSDIYRWATTGHTAQRAFEVMRPHLGLRRTQRGDEILAEAKVVQAECRTPRTCPECGGIFDVVDYGTNKIYCNRTCWQRAVLKRPGARDRINGNKRRYKQRQRGKAAVIPGQSAIPNTVPGDNLWR